MKSHFSVDHSTGNPLASSVAVEEYGPSSSHQRQIMSLSGYLQVGILGTVAGPHQTRFRGPCLTRRETLISDAPQMLKCTHWWGVLPLQRLQVSLTLQENSDGY